MRKKSEFNFWDFLIWIGIILLLGWAFLKAIGIINTPVWVEMIPYFGIGTTAIGAAYKIGKIMMNLEIIGNKVDKILTFEEDFREVNHNQQLCLEGKLQGSPYKKENEQ